MMKNKKGELTTQQIVILVILIISFAVLLFLLFRLNLNNESEKQTCHNSVVTRGASIIPTEGVPLQCQREYSCITTKRTCDKGTNPEIYRVETKQEVYDVLANMMADCWWMYGEGKINYVGKDMQPKLYCSFCNQVYFDNSLKTEFFTSGEFDKREFYDYLAVKNMTNSDQTYAEYLFGTNDIYKIHSGDFGKVDLSKTYYVLMGITSDVNNVGWGLAAGAVVGGLLLTPVTGGLSLVSVVGVLAVAGGAAGGYFIAPVVAGDSGNDYVVPSLIEANSQAFNDLGCQVIASLS